MGRNNAASTLKIQIYTNMVTLYCFNDKNKWKQSNCKSMQISVLHALLRLFHNLSLRFMTRVKKNPTGAPWMY